MFSYEKLLAINVVLVILSVLCSCNNEVFNDDLLQRSRRQLLFPNSTLLQFNAGVGTPTPIKTVNVNYAFQANFQLPWNRTQIPFDILEANSAYITEARKKRDLTDEDNRIGNYESDARIYHFYKYVEDVLNGYGHNGSSCVLKTLCQLGSEPLHTDMEDDLLHELASFVLNPENDTTEQRSPESEPYIEAHRAGRSNQDCVTLYESCSMSLIDIFSRLGET